MVPGPPSLEIYIYIYICLFGLYLLLLKLKTKNWKYCNKIIFKCVNSIVEPIFNIFKCVKHTQYMNSAYTVHKQWILSHSLKKKEKERERERTCFENADAKSKPAHDNLKIFIYLPFKKKFRNTFSFFIPIKLNFTP